MQVSAGPYVDTRAMASDARTMRAGIISGKVKLDYDYIGKAVENAADGMVTTWKGGNDKTSFDAMPGLISMGLRGNTAGAPGTDWNQTGMVTTAGSDVFDFSSHRSFEGNWTFQGIITTEQRYSDNHLDPRTKDPNAGLFGVSVAGKENTRINGPFRCWAGELACWRAPRVPNDPRVADPAPEGDMAKDQWKRQRDMSSHNPHNHWEIVPFDYTDFTQNTAGALATITDVRGLDDGIANVPFREFFQWEGIHAVPSVSCEQEQAAGRKYGFIGVGLAFVETLANHGLVTINDVVAPFNEQNEAAREKNTKDVAKLSTKIGLWKLDSGDVKNEIFFKALTNMFFMDAIPDEYTSTIKTDLKNASGKDIKDLATNTAVGQDDAADEANYYKLRIHLSRFTDGALYGSIHEKERHIFGKFANTADPGDISHVVLRY